MATHLRDIDTRCITDDSLPWIPLEPYAGRVCIKLLSADPVSGEVILVLRAPPGTELPRHRTSSSTTIYTVQGRWKYREHDWVAGPGSLVIEAASASNTPQVPADGTDDAILFMLVRGEVQLLDAEGRTVAAESWRTAVARYHAYCRENELEPRDLSPQCTGDSLRAASGA
jgi:hypothetical protein